MHWETKKCVTCFIEMFALLQWFGTKPAISPRKSCRRVIERNLLYQLLLIFVVLQLLSHIRLFVIPWSVAYQAPLSSTISRSLLKFMSSESVMLSNHLIFCCPFFCLQSFPASGSFPVSWIFVSGGQSVGDSALASVLPMNTQG